MTLLTFLNVSTFVSFGFSNNSCTTCRSLPLFHTRLYRASPVPFCPPFCLLSTRPKVMSLENKLPPKKSIRFQTRVFTNLSIKWAFTFTTIIDHKTIDTHVNARSFLFFRNQQLVIIFHLSLIQVTHIRLFNERLAWNANWGKPYVR